MKSVDRQPVDGTDNPTIYILRRVTTDKNGKTQISKRWSAEYSFEGKQHYFALKTKNRNEAIQAVHRLRQKIISGQMDDPKPVSITVDELAKRYLEALEGKGRAPKTIEKYRRVLENFAGVCKEGLSWKRVESKKTTFGSTAPGPSKKP